MLKRATWRERWGLFRCNVLDWHKPVASHDGRRDRIMGWDGVSFISRCRRCGRRLLMDHHGDWFGVGPREEGPR